MRLDDVLARLPEGYRAVTSARGALAVLEEETEALLAAGLGPDGPGVVPPSDLAGRRPLGEVRGAGGARLVVRRFTHGGILRWTNEARFLDPARPFEELLVATRLAERGVPTPTVVAARAVRAGVLGWTLHLVTRRIEGATDSSHALDRLAEEPPVVAARLFARLGTFVAELHRAGLRHTDLTPRNMLVGDEAFDAESPGPVRAWVLDLDRCELAGALPDADRRRALARLWRYVARRDDPAAPVLARTRLVRFLAAYAETLGGGASWRTEWRAVEAEARRGTLLHRVGWRLEELFGGGPETRDGRNCT